MKTPTMRHGWLVIRSTSCWSVGIPSPARTWPRSLPCRVLKMLRVVRMSAGRRGEPHQGTARRHADRPDQLLELFGEHLPGAADSGGVRADAGDATALVPDPPRPGASSDLARAFSKTRSPSHRHGASHRAALASSVSLSR